MVLQDNNYLGQFCADHPNVKIGHEQAATYSDAWRSFPDHHGVVDSDLITAAMTEISDEADAEAKLGELAQSTRICPSMK